MTLLLSTAFSLEYISSLSCFCQHCFTLLTSNATGSSLCYESKLWLRLKLKLKLSASGRHPDNRQQHSQFNIKEFNTVIVSHYKAAALDKPTLLENSFSAWNCYGHNPVELAICNMKLDFQDKKKKKPFVPKKKTHTGQWQFRNRMFSTVWNYGLLLVCMLRKIKLEKL